MPIKEIYNSLMDGDYYSLGVLLFIVISIVLFKDIKKSLVDNRKVDLQFIDESITAYARVYRTVSFFRDRKIEKYELLDELSLGYKYFDESTIKKLYRLINNVDIFSDETKIIEELLKDIEAKLHYLKRQQIYDSIIKENQLTSDDFIKYLIKNNFEIYIKTLLSTIISLIIVYNFIIISINNHGKEIQYISSWVFILGLIVFIISLSLAIDLMIKYGSMKGLVYFIVDALSIIIFIYFIGISQNELVKLICSIVFIIYQSVQIACNSNEIKKSRI